MTHSQSLNKKTVKKTPGILAPKDPANASFVAPEGYWIRCTECHAILQQSAVSENMQVCTECNHHFRMSGRKRIALVCDDGTFQECDQDLKARDVLNFFDSKAYKDRLKASIAKTRLNEAFVSGTGKLSGMPVEVGAFDFSFMGGSMGMIVGEKVARLFDRAAKNKRPAIIFHASGGARMQEGLLSLMQMAKTTVALSQLKALGIPYISVLTDPTTGGVAASFAMLGDVQIAEPRALIGFAGPRVIQQTISQKLPDNFQRAEFLLAHGMLDAIVPRHEIKSYIERILHFLIDSKE